MLPSSPAEECKPQETDDDHDDRHPDEHQRLGGVQALRRLGDRPRHQQNHQRLEAQHSGQRSAGGPVGAKASFGELFFGRGNRDRFGRGLVVELLGRLPRGGDKVELARNATAEVIALSRRRVTRMRVEVKKLTGTAGEGGGQSTEP